MFLDNKLNFGKRLTYIANKFNKPIGNLGNLQKLLPRRSLVTIWKHLIKAHLDYEDMIFDLTENMLSAKI